MGPDLAAFPPTPQCYGTASSLSAQSPRGCVFIPLPHSSPLESMTFEEVNKCLEKYHFSVLKEIKRDNESN